MAKYARDGSRALILALGAGLGVMTAACAYLLVLRERELRGGGSGGRKRSQDSMPVEGKEFFPPLPDEVVALLQHTRLCHLSTTGGDGIPHLSLMNFTYLREEELIIMTTRTDTKKYELLQSSPKVALLIHDFPQARDGDGPSPPPQAPPSPARREMSGTGNTYSITLNGVARVQQGEAAERFRAIHLRNNQGYAQFIEGEGIAVFTVQVVSARICNVQDRVTYWDVNSATTTSTTNAKKG